jgi:hypothetical protein
MFVFEGDYYEYGPESENETMFCEIGQVKSNGNTIKGIIPKNIRHKKACQHKKQIYKNINRLCFA